jgi:PPM family protein phosphatase
MTTTHPRAEELQQTLRMDGPDGTAGPAASSVLVDAAGRSDVGCVRERNEDRFVVGSLYRSISVDQSNVEDARRMPTTHLEATLLAVADGMGGEGGGAEASSLALRTVTQHLSASLPWRARDNVSAWAPRAQEQSIPGMRDELSAAFQRGNEQVLAAGRELGTPTMGTTLTLAVIVWPDLYLAHIGDSRCYLLRSGALQLLTHDQTLAQECRDRGMEIEGDQRRAWESLLTGAIGAGSHDVPLVVARFSLSPSDRLLLCSDGLTKCVGEHEVMQVVARHETPDGACRELIEMARDRDCDDNVTVVCARMRPR